MRCGGRFSFWFCFILADWRSWSESCHGINWDLGESPFVRVFRTVGIPAAGHVMNFVVLTAALSSAMCNLYFTSRLLFSLARGGYAPAGLGKLDKQWYAGGGGDGVWEWDCCCDFCFAFF